MRRLVADTHPEEVAITVRVATVPMMQAAAVIVLTADIKAAMEAVLEVEAEENPQEVGASATIEDRHNILFDMEAPRYFWFFSGVKQKGRRFGTRVTTAHLSSF
jgi:hypothetical protein